MLQTRRGGIFVTDLASKIDHVLAEAHAGRRVIRADDGTVILNDQTLAWALGMKPAAFANAKAGRRPLQPQAIQQLCRLFSLDEDRFVRAPFDDFVRAREGQTALAPWRVMVEQAPQDHCRIWLLDPRGANLEDDNYRYAGPRGALEAHMTAVPRAAPLWFTATSPGDAAGRPVWPGWAMLLLNHKRNSGTFRSLLPRFAAEFGFDDLRFPSSAAMLRFPRQGELTHEGTADSGVFEIVLAVARKPFPERIVTGFAAPDAEDSIIQEALSALAHWLGPRVTDGDAALVKAAYRVVA